ncbi:MAG: acetate--CoA ligase family protein, partial [Brevibacterium sp.]|nr:acetate--CoA ligase family protein [Brevibacterium sp.]
IVHSMSADSRAVAALWENSIPVYTSIDSVMRVVAGAGFYASPAGRITEALEQSGPVPPWGTGYGAARDTISAAGGPGPRAVTLSRGTTLAEVMSGSSLTPPFVLKAGWPAHKTELAAIALGLGDTAALEGAHAEMVARLGEGEYIVEEMDTRKEVVEILVGGRRDENFGPIVMVGAGGTETELYGDTWLELAPVSHAEALDMVSRLTCYRLLTGWRGKPAADLDELAQIIVSVSRLIAGSNEIQEIEINPVRVTPVGALAVDALVVTDPVNDSEDSDSDSDRDRDIGDDDRTSSTSSTDSDRNGEKEPL